MRGYGGDYMYLNLLNKEEQVGFLQLAYHVVHIDNKLDERENAILQSYQLEMGLSEEIGMNNIDFNNVVSIFQKSNKRSQNAVLQEICCLIFADGIYHKNEDELLRKLQKAFDITDEKVEACKQWAQQVLKIYSRGEELLNQ